MVWFSLWPHICAILSHGLGTFNLRLLSYAVSTYLYLHLLSTRAVVKILKEFLHMQHVKKCSCGVF
jgi:hypothetical protein